MLSDDGSLVAFESMAENLGPADTNGAYDVYVRDRNANTVTRVSVDTKGNPTSGDSTQPRISGSGAFVLFSSDSRDAVPMDSNQTFDIFLHVRATGAVARVSLED